VYEAKAKLSALIRAVKERKRVCITERGRDVAWLIPVPRPDSGPAERLAAFRAAGIIHDGVRSPADLRAVATRPGSLQRFLDERD
jgi:prevent-host-death family protein